MVDELALHVYQPGGPFIRIADSVQGGNYRLRSLFYLVCSCADSLQFERSGDTVTYVEQQSIADTPWRQDVGQFIAKHFAYELQVIIPEGIWKLGVRGR